MASNMVTGFLEIYDLKLSHDVTDDKTMVTN
jgi:hypothetical protein